MPPDRKLAPHRDQPRTAQPRDRIPSVADLAAELKIKNLTVHKVFQRLEKAGLLHSEVGRGTFVAGNGDARDGSPNGEPSAASVAVRPGTNSGWAPRFGIASSAIRRPPPAQ